MRSGNAPDTMLAVFIILSWFVSGAGYLQGLGNYQTWLDMGGMMSNADFLSLRRAHYWWIYPLVVVPGILSVMLNGALLVWRPAGLSRWLLPALFTLGTGMLVSTALIQVPLQDRIDAAGYDRAVIQRLIETDMWLRKLPGLVFNLLLAALTVQAVRRRG